MLKKIILVPLILISFSAFSQVGVKAGFAFSNVFYKDLTNTSYNDFYPGFDIGVTYDFTDNIRGELLYEGMFRSSNDGLGPIISWLMPVTIGGDYRFLEGSFHPYVGVNLGYANIGNSYRFNNSTISSSNSIFLIYPKVGMNYEFTEKLWLDLTLKYDFFIRSNTSMAFGMNVGIIYRL